MAHQLIFDKLIEKYGDYILGLLNINISDQTVVQCSHTITGFSLSIDDEYFD